MMVVMVVVMVVVVAGFCLGFTDATVLVEQ